MSSRPETGFYEKTYVNNPGRMVATDLDGTLFNDDAELSSATLDALERANKAGYCTVAVTGRSWRTAAEKLERAKGIDYIICSNGAYLYRQYTRRIVWDHVIEQAQVASLVSAVRSHVPDACFGCESRSGLYFEPGFVNLATNPDMLESGGSASEPGSQDLYRLFIRSGRQTHLELLDTLHPEFSGLATITTSGAPFLEATSPGTDKATSLSRLAAELGISADNTIAFGDNLNDMPMLGWAGTAVAMGNALPQIKAIAHHTTRSNADHGVAHYLEKLLSTH